MPEITRFYGIVIRMFMEPNTQHNRLHFHAYYQGQIGIIAIDEIALIAGRLPQKQLKIVLAWEELHQNELLEDWNLLRTGNQAYQIEPLKYFVYDS